MVNPRAEKVLYTVSGSGICHMGGFEYELQALACSIRRGARQSRPRNEAKQQQHFALETSNEAKEQSLRPSGLRSQTVGCVGGRSYPQNSAAHN